MATRFWNNLHSSQLGFYPRGAWKNILSHQKSSFKPNIPHNLIAKKVKIICNTNSKGGWTMPKKKKRKLGCSSGLTVPNVTLRANPPARVVDHFEVNVASNLSRQALILHHTRCLTRMRDFHGLSPLILNLQCHLESKAKLNFSNGSYVKTLQEIRRHLIQLRR